MTVSVIMDVVEMLGSLISRYHGVLSQPDRARVNAALIKLTQDCVSFSKRVDSDLAEAETREGRKRKK